MKRKTVVYAGTAILLLAVALAACGSYVGEGDTTTESGLQHIVIEEGDGPSPQPGEIVSVHYRGTLEDGTEFDNSYDRGQPIAFPLGRGMVIPGWEEGIALMKVGDAPPEGFDESLTAPLPVFGLRLAYRVTPRASVTATADWFFLRYDDSSGVLEDFLVMFSHRTWKHVGFAGGLNLWTQKIEFVDDDLLLEVDQGFVGYLAAVTFHF